MPRLAALAVVALGARLALGQPAPTPTRTERPIGPGTRLLQWTDPAGPNRFAAVETNLAESLITLAVAPAADSPLGLTPLSAQAAALERPERYPIAGINADYFYAAGTRQPAIPTNAMVLQGNLLRTPFPRSCLILRDGRRPEIQILTCAGLLTPDEGAAMPLHHVNQLPKPEQASLLTRAFGESVRLAKGECLLELRASGPTLVAGRDHEVTVERVTRGDGVAALGEQQWAVVAAGSLAEAAARLAVGTRARVRFDITPAIGPTDSVLGGGPRILRDGVAAVEPEGGTLGEAFAQARHPRTAVGFDGDKLVLLVIDGRRPEQSVGATLAELGETLRQLGCREGMNLDGGGSTTLWVRGTVRNQPSDGKERPVANGLFVLSTAPKEAPCRLLSPITELALLPGAQVPLPVEAEDRYHNPVTVSPAEVRWEVSGGVGSVTDGTFTAALAAPLPEFSPGRVRAVYRDLTLELPVRLHPRPTRVEITPPPARLRPGEAFRFGVRALDSLGRSLIPPPPAWTQEGSAGSIDAAGLFRAAPQPGRGRILARLGDDTAAVDVVVSEPIVRLIDDFERAETWTVRSVPATVRGGIGPGTTAKAGRRALQLDYDLRGSGTRAVYAEARRELGAARLLHVWVHGDGQGTWLRLKLRDAASTAQLIDIARAVDWKGWKRLEVPLPPSAARPLVLEAAYVVAVGASPGAQGNLFLDHLEAEE